MKRRSFIKNAVLLSLAVNLTPVMAEGGIPENKPNIVFILADQWRASATGYAGDPNVHTPNIDRLAGEGYIFRNAVSVCPVCTPYRASLITGRYPTSTGMFLNDAHLPPDEVCIGDALAAAGYETAWIGKWHLDGHGRHSYIPPERRRGFSYWKAAECDHNYNHSHYYTGNSDEKLFWEGYDVFAQTKDARQYLIGQANGKDPFALFISYGAPHFPHNTAPEEYKARYKPENIILPVNVPDSMKAVASAEAQGYYAHCEAIDKSIGELLRTLDELGMKENTIVVFTSDHGEMLGSHGVKPKSKQVPLRESAGVPFLLRYPGLLEEKGTIIDVPLTTPDIFPTLFGLAGLKIPKTVEGDNLMPVCKNTQENKDRAVLYMQVAPWIGGEYGKEYRALKTAQFTYVRSLDGPWLLFDDVKDPFQMDNLAGNPKYSDVLEELDNRLKINLHKIMDDFKPAQYYIEEWGLVPGSHGSIPYSNSEDTHPQTPRRKGT